MFWFGVHFPDLGLEVFQNATVGADSVRKEILVEDNRVILRNEAAVAASIGLGSTLATAHSIVPGLCHHIRDEAKEQQRLRFLAEMLYRFTSQVCLQPPHSLVLEVSGSLKLFGELPVLQHEVESLCQTLGHRVLLQGAPTPSAALILARSQQQDLAAASLQYTQLNATTQERFANMGIHTLGPLLELPETELAQRFGPRLLNFLRRLTGRLADPQQGIVPSATFASGLHLLDAINNKDALLFPMQRLLGELHVWLVGRQLGAEQICWQFKSYPGRATKNAVNNAANKENHSVTLPVSFAQAQQSREAFLNITRLKLEQAQLPEDVISLGLTAKRLQPWHTDSQELFQQLFSHEIAPETRNKETSHKSRHAPAKASELVDQLRARLGDQACHGISLADQHSPEHAWQKSLPSMQNMRKRQESEALPLKRPLWLFDPPRRVAGSELTLLRGPERIHSGWWQQSIYRDYYLARHNKGAECWAFLNREEDRSEQWYLHGYFA